MTTVTSSIEKRWVPRAAFGIIIALASAMWTAPVHSGEFPKRVWLASLDGATGFRLVGQGLDSGRAVASAGDVDDDGIADIIIGVPWSSKAYLVFGRSSGFPARINLSRLDGATGFRLDGVGFDLTGWSVASAGDVNDDGIADLIIGAPWANELAGSAYLVFGSSSGFPARIDLSSLDGARGFRVDGRANGGSGYSVAGAGDVNNDGIADMIIGAPDPDGPGRLSAGAGFVVFGRSSGFPAKINVSSLDGATGFRLLGAAAGDHTGYSVASAGDVNDDGIADMLIGALDADPHRHPDAGSSYVVFGRSSGFPARINFPSLDGPTGFRLLGAAAGDITGLSVASAGDVNNDGIADMIIGAPAGLRTDAGSSYMVFGR